MNLFNNEAPSETRTSSLSVEDVLLHFFEDELRILHMKMFYFVFFIFYYIIQLIHYLRYHMNLSTYIVA